jgi:hypothetical protein
MSAQLAGSSTPDVAEPHRQAIATYRSIARWVVSSFGATAGAVVVGVQLTSIGELHGSRLVASLGCLGVLLSAVLLIIGAALRVLTPIRSTHKELATSSAFKPLWKDLKRKNPAADPQRQLARTVSEYEAAQRYRQQAQKSHNQHKSPETEDALIDAESLTADWKRPVMKRLWLGHALYVRRRFWQAVVTTFVAVVVAAVAGTGFAYVSSETTTPPPRPVTNVHVVVNEPKTCVDLYLALDRLAQTTPIIGSRWPTRSLGAQDHACGFRNNAELTRFLSYLAHR